MQATWKLDLLIVILNGFLIAAYFVFSKKTWNAVLASLLKLVDLSVDAFFDNGRQFISPSAFCNYLCKSKYV